GWPTARTWSPCWKGPWPPAGRPTGWPPSATPGCRAAWSTTSARRSRWPRGWAWSRWPTPAGSPRWPTRSGCPPPRSATAWPRPPWASTPPRCWAGSSTRRSPTYGFWGRIAWFPGAPGREEGGGFAPPFGMCRRSSREEAAAQVTMAETGRRSRPGDLHRRRVLLVAESAGLAAVLHYLLDPADRLSRLGSLRELAESRALEAADVVVLDVPPEDRAVGVGQARRRYLGPLVVLVDRADGPGPDDACRLLPRPF